jgi:lipid-binding SYLF domain-containing protein
MRRLGWLAAGGLLLVATAAQAARERDLDPETRAHIRRRALSAMARDAMTTLVSKSDEAAELYGRAAGYAVFDNVKGAFIVSGGGGVGVAVNKHDGREIYMKMGTLGVGVGIGGQSYRVVFLFETPDAYDRFVEQGWQADTQANAVAGTTGKNAAATFRSGVAVYTLTNKGLLAQADISGTRYWKNQKLNP